MGTIQSEMNLYNLIEAKMRETGDWMNSAAVRELLAADGYTFSAHEVSTKMWYMGTQELLHRRDCDDPNHPLIKCEYQWNFDMPAKKYKHTTRRTYDVSARANTWMGNNTDIAHPQTLSELCMHADFFSIFGNVKSRVSSWLHKASKTGEKLVARTANAGVERFAYYWRANDRPRILEKVEPDATLQQVIQEAIEAGELVAEAPQTNAMYKLKVDAKENSVTLRVHNIEITIVNLD